MSGGPFGPHRASLLNLARRSTVPGTIAVLTADTYMRPCLFVGDDGTMMFADVRGDRVLGLAGVPGATSWVQLSSSAGGQPLAAVEGDALNIDFYLRGKGTGRVIVDDDLVVTGTLFASGGQLVPIGPWAEVNILAGKAAATITPAGLAGGCPTIPVLRAGSVLGISVCLDAALTSTDANAATITVGVQINGVGIAETLVLNAPGGGGGGDISGALAIPIDTRLVAASGRLGVTTASSANIPNAARDLTVVVWVEQ